MRLTVTGMCFVWETEYHLLATLLVILTEIEYNIFAVGLRVFFFFSLLENIVISIDLCSEDISTLLRHVFQFPVLEKHVPGMCINKLLLEDNVSAAKNEIQKCCL